MAGISCRWWSTVRLRSESAKRSEPNPADVDDYDAMILVERSALGCIVECPALIGEVDVDLGDDFLLADLGNALAGNRQSARRWKWPDKPLLSIHSHVDLAYIAGLVTLVTFSGIFTLTFQVPANPQKKDAFGTWPWNSRRAAAVTIGPIFFARSRIISLWHRPTGDAIVRRRGGRAEYSRRL